MESSLQTAVSRSPGFSLRSVSQNGTHIVKLACRPPAGQAGLGRPLLLKPIAHLLETPRGSSKPDPVGNDKIVDIDDNDPQCFLSLTDFPRTRPKKDPNVFYHLRAMFHLSTSLFYHLQKRGGCAGYASRRIRSGRGQTIPLSPLIPALTGSAAVSLLESALA